MNNKKLFKDNYHKLSNDIEENIRKTYKIIEVDWLNEVLVNSKIFDDNKYYKKFPKKQETVFNMLNYYIYNKNREIYKKTDYLCNEREKICICNTHAEDFRKIYDGINYKKGDKYISWFQNNNVDF